MRRLALLFAGCVVAAGCGAEHARAPQIIALDVYNVDGAAGFEGTALVKLRRTTLRPYGHRLRLGDATTGGVFSPDRKTLALGAYNDGNVLLVDPDRLGLVKKVHVVKGRDEADVEVDVLGWPRRNLLVAETIYDGAWWAQHPAQLLFVDPERHKVVRRVPLGGSDWGAVTLRNGAIAVLRLGATNGGSPGGTPTVVIVGPDGHVGKAVLRRLRLVGPDSVRVDGETYPAEREPGVATDGRRVFVVTADRPVVEIDPSPLSIRYHAVRLEDMHLPAPPPMTPGSGGVHYRLSRSATWLGHGLLAVSGLDELPGHVPGFGAGHSEVSTAVQIVDARTWRVVHTIRATGCQPARKLILCAGDVAAGRKGEAQTRLVAYDRRWRIRYRHGPRSLYWQLVGGRLLATEDYGQGRTFELARETGRRLHPTYPPRYADGFLVWNPPD